MSRSVMAQLGSDPSEISNIANNIATGDLRIQFSGNNEKIIGVYGSMKNMADNLAAFAKQTGQMTDQLSSASEELSSVSSQMASSSEEMSAQSATAAAS